MPEPAMPNLQEKGRVPACAATWAGVLLSLACLTIRAQDVSAPASGRKGTAAEDGSVLTVERIFASGEFRGEGFSARWSADGRTYLTLEPSSGPAGGRDIVEWDPETGTRRVLVPADHLVPSGRTRPLSIEGYEFSADRSKILIYTNSRRVWRRNTRGDYWVLDRSAVTLRKLGGDAPPSSLMFAKFSPDGRRVAYVRERNIYVEDLSDGRIRALTRDGGEDVINGTGDWVYEEELGVRDGFRWSPDGRWIAFWRFDTSGVGRFPLVRYARTVYPEVFWLPYPKVGTRNPECRIGIVAVPGPESTSAASEGALPGPRWLEFPGSARDHYVARMEWAGNSEELVIQRLNRRQNTLHLYLANHKTGALRVLLVERDEAWVDVEDAFRWVDGGTRFLWLSERDGWRHLYLGSRAGGELELLTPGAFDVLDVVAVDDGAARSVWFTASPEETTREYLFRARLDGSGFERITPLDQPGTHRYSIAPGSRWAFHTYSSFNVPPRTELVRLPGHEVVRVLVTNEKLKKRLRALRRRPVEFFRVDIGGGVSLDAWCLKPPGLDPKKKYPLLVHVYGEPAGRTVVDRWQGSFYLWHLMMAQRGYAVMSFDNRGTPAPRGRAWRKCVYRKIGILAPEDQAAAVRKVIETRPYLDGGRVGIWGWSGGGSMSLNAIFKYPDLYRTAVSVAPVPNQRLYDTIYQERYMGLPEDNVEGYIEGSPIHFAHKLEGNLLIVHGTWDDNVHMQGTLALVDELIRRKKKFDLLLYPGRRHGIHEGPNTTLHLWTAITDYFMTHLPPGPR